MSVEVDWNDSCTPIIQLPDHLRSLSIRKNGCDLLTTGRPQSPSRRVLTDTAIHKEKNMSVFCSGRKVGVIFEMILSTGQLWLMKDDLCLEIEAELPINSSVRRIAWRDPEEGKGPHLLAVALKAPADLLCLYHVDAEHCTITSRQFIKGIEEFAWAPTHSHQIALCSSTTITINEWSNEGMKVLARRSIEWSRDHLYYAVGSSLYRVPFENGNFGEGESVLLAAPPNVIVPFKEKLIVGCRPAVTVGSSIVLNEMFRGSEEKGGSQLFETPLLLLPGGASLGTKPDRVEPEGEGSIKYMESHGKLVEKLVPVGKFDRVFELVAPLGVSSMSVHEEEGLVVCYSGSGDTVNFEEFSPTHCRKVTVLRTKSIDDSQLEDVQYRVKFPSDERPRGMIFHRGQLLFLVSKEKGEVSTALPSPSTQKMDVRLVSFTVPVLLSRMNLLSRISKREEPTTLRDVFWAISGLKEEMSARLEKIQVELQRQASRLERVEEAMRCSSPNE
ncbi:hypothetical protein PROFUN_14328 [Planoprotostelium fungivorum]|uniref:Uncharacterized protein n=1 Tax=Planoprotostelium fungivorum TaxID=1890364 RepID=A0A2P6N0J4_9EUKA|nr:hypothetical protein PROFUN_14328 [Planoprotostelium fungivorum]